jgi:hypothetical protein
LAEGKCQRSRANPHIIKGSFSLTSIPAKQPDIVSVVLCSKPGAEYLGYSEWRKKMKIRIGSTTISFLITLLVLNANAAMGEMVQAGLVSYWNFDDGSADDSAGGNTGEMIGAPASVAGKIGNGFQFNGTSDNIRIPSLDISPAMYPTITLMAWIYPTSDGAGGQASRRFVFGHDDGGWDRGLLMQSANWRLGTGNDGTDYWDTGATVDVNEWQHVTIVYSEDDILFYKDGVEHSYGSPGDIGSGNPFLLIGTHPSQARFFQGIIDEASVYSRVLSEAEIRQNMDASGMAVESLSKLAGCWGWIKIGD